MVINKLQQQIDRLIEYEKEAEWVVRNMQMTALIEIETLLHEVLSKVVQEDDILESVTLKHVTLTIF